MFNGALSALITPFRDGVVDEAALRDLIEWQIQSGIDGIVPCGSTGESATLTHAEHEQVIKLAVAQARKASGDKGRPLSAVMASLRKRIHEPR
jgi:4-hydroxy-tetrahydrodipicolinate synthase